MNRRRSGSFMVAVALLAAVLLSSCSGRQPSGKPAGPGATAGTITMRDFSFQPASTEVRAGSTVTWKNGDSTQHTVTADDGTFESGRIDPGESYSFTFSKPGTYAYHCSIHPPMVGQVVVK